MKYPKPNKDETDFIIKELTNYIRKKGVILPNEFNAICKDLTQNEKQFVKEKIRALGYKVDEDMIEFTDESKPTAELKDKDILAFLIKPEYVNTDPNTIQVGSEFYKGIVASGFPAVVSENWLGELIQEKSNIDFSMFIEPSSIRAIEIYLNNQLRKVENDLYKYEQRGMSNPALQARKKQLLDQIDSLVKGKYRLYKMNLYIAAKGKSKDDVDLLGSRIMNMLHSKGIEAKYSIKYNEQLLKSIIPVCTNHMDAKPILVPGPAAAASFPFSSSFYDIDEKDGILLGFNSNHIPIAKSIWSLPKYVGCIIGATGSGKSYSAKALVLNDRMVNGTKIFILDPENEYTDMCERIHNSQVIHLHRKSKNIPNLLSLMGGNLTDKLITLPKVFSVLLKGVTEAQKPLLEQALIKAYRKKGIVETDSNSWSRSPPSLSDLIKILRKNMKSCKDFKIRSEYETMVSRLSRYTEGIFKFMDVKGDGMLTTSDFTVFEFKAMPDEIRPVLMLVLLEFIRTRFKMSNDKKMLVLDEAWRVLKSKEEAAYVEEFARTFRKSNGSLILITQSVDELRGCAEGKAYLANSAFAYILKTEGVVLKETAELFGFNDTEKDIIRNAAQGEGILIWDKKHHKIRIKVDPETNDLITTNPEELKRIRAKKEARKKEEEKKIAKLEKKVLKKKSVKKSTKKNINKKKKK